MRLLVIAPILALASAAHAQAPEDRGPLTVMEWDAGRIDVGGAMIRTRVVYPSAVAAPVPIVAVVHGFLRNGDVMMETARVFASRGFVAIVPDMPCGAGGCDHEANAAQVSALLEWAIAESASAGSQIEGLIDGERRGLVGHSWGGLGTFLSAAGDPSIDVWVGFDPQEDAGAALAAAPNVAIPNAHLMAEVDGACNGDWGPDVYAATATPHLRVTIATSGHCDPEEPTNGLCDIGCTAGDRATTPIFRRYAVAFVACALGTDGSMEAYVGGSAFDDDVASGRLIEVMESGIDAIDCGAPIVTIDAGVPDGDAGSIDGGSTRDAGSSGRADSGVRSDAGTGTTSDGGCGCRAAAMRTGAPLPWLALAAVWVLRRRRRQPSRGGLSAGWFRHPRFARSER